MRTQRCELLYFLVPVLLVLAWGVVYPNAALITDSLHKAGEWSLANYTESFASASTRESIGTSIVVSVLTVLLCALVGIPLAFLMRRFEFRFRKILSALSTLPLLLPPLVGVIAFMFLYGESGIATRALQRFLGMSEPPWSLRGMSAILLVHTYTMYVYFYLFVSSGLDQIDGAQVEAARTLGASRARIFFQVVLPGLTPSLIGASLLTFMTAMASFSAPLLFGGQVRVLTLQIFNSKMNNDTGLALTQTVLLAVFSLLFLLLFMRWENSRRFQRMSRSTPWQRSEVRSLVGRVMLPALGGVIVLLLLLPHLTIVLVSFVKEGFWTTQILPPVYTFENYVRLFRESRFSDPVINSVLSSGLAGLGGFVWSFIAAYLLGRLKRLPRGILSSLVLLPWALPGTVLGLTVATAFSQRTIWNLGTVLVGTFWILPLVYFLRTMPLTVRSIQASLQKMDASIEEAARTLGSSLWFRIRHVVLPLVMPAAVMGAVMAFVTALGEFVASILVYTVSSRPISIEIWSQMRLDNLGGAAVYGVVLIVLIAASLLLANRVFGARGGAEIF